MMSIQKRRTRNVFLGIVKEMGGLDLLRLICIHDNSMFMFANKEFDNAEIKITEEFK